MAGARSWSKSTLLTDRQRRPSAGPHLGNLLCAGTSAAGLYVVVDFRSVRQHVRARTRLYGLPWRPEHARVTRRRPRSLAAASWNDMDANNPRRTNERLSTLRIRPPRSATKPALLWDRTLRRNADFASPFSKHDDRRRASRSGRLSRQKRYERRSAQSRFALHIPRRERNLSR